MPKVSILLPTFNGARFLPAAIRSVRSQTFRDWELLVLDDGSTDATASIVKEFSTNDPRIIHSPNERNLGIQRTLNRGLDIARGEYVARIDDDDEWIDAEKLEKQVQFLDAHPDHVLVGTGVVLTDENGRESTRFLMPETDAAIRSRMLFKNCFIHSSVLFRRDAVIESGRYPEEKECLHVEDYALWLKLGLRGKLHNLPLFATRYTSRADNISSRNKVDQLKKDLVIAGNYRREYPNYFRARLLGSLRLLGIKIFRFLPARLGNFIFKIYKEV